MWWRDMRMEAQKKWPSWIFWFLFAQKLKFSLFFEYCEKSSYKISIFLAFLRPLGHVWWEIMAGFVFETVFVGDFESESNTYCRFWLFAWRETGVQPYRDRWNRGGGIFSDFKWFQMLCMWYQIKGYLVRKKSSPKKWVVVRIFFARLPWKRKMQYFAYFYRFYLILNFFILHLNFNPLHYPPHSFV